MCSVSAKRLIEQKLHRHRTYFFIQDAIFRSAVLCVGGEMSRSEVFGEISEPEMILSLINIILFWDGEAGLPSAPRSYTPPEES